jgi:hypothetical protein
MAGLASHDCVQSNERISRNIVIKTDVRRPCYGLMATAAIAAQLRLVDVLHTVAVKAGHRYFRAYVLAVAVATDRFGMCTQKRKARIFAVIKLRRLPTFIAVTAGTISTE